QVYTVKYEDIIYNYKETIKKICSFLNIECDNHILNWEKFAKVRRSSNLTRKLKSIYQSSVNKWKHKKYEKIINNFMRDPRALKLLKHLNYIK
ncbi:sulfotransferase, partial [Candidatus Woesearchaeota archaeon]|nr:sulfotransferase [Candidatus Woesearchaeota archaeon]